MTAQVDSGNFSEIAKRIDRRIQPWKWGLVLALTFAVLGAASVFSDVDGSGRLADALAGYLIYCLAFGGVFGALAAYTARNIVKAIRC